LTTAVEREFGAGFQDLQDNTSVGMGHAGDGDEIVSRPLRQIADVLRKDVKKIVIGARRAVTYCYTSLESMNMRSFALLEASDGA
jgi:hypothetical protein